MRKHRGCEVFYITNRDVRERASTLKNLNDLGFPVRGRSPPACSWKAPATRPSAVQRWHATHRIVLLVGDQLRDFDERFKDRA